MPGPLSPAGRQKILLIFGLAVLVLGGGVLFRTFWVAREVGRGGTYSRVRALLVRRLGAEPGAVRPDAPLDSLRPGGIDRLELVEALKEEFETELPEADAVALVTVQDVVAALDARRLSPASGTGRAEPGDP